MMHDTATTEVLLLECARLLNQYGPGPEVDSFIAAHEENQEFAELARFSIEVKRALMSGEGDGGEDAIGRISPSLRREVRGGRS